MPDVSTEGSPTTGRALAAIVFSDVAGFTEHARRDEAAALAALLQDHALLRSICLDHGGEFVKSTGDGLLMVFGSAVQAAESALAMRDGLAQRAGDGIRLDHRIGLHVGDVVRQAGDAMGDGVNVAARLQAEAPANGLALSQAAIDMLQGKVSLTAHNMGPRQLKGLDTPITVWTVSPVGGSLVTDVGRNLVAAPARIPTHRIVPELDADGMRAVILRAQEIQCQTEILRGRWPDIDATVAAAAELGIDQDAMFQAVRERVSAPLVELNAGDLVFATGADGHAYVSRVRSAGQGVATITFLNGTEVRIACADLQALALAPGTVVQVRSRAHKLWTRATISNINPLSMEATVEVMGKTEVIPFSALRLGRTPEWLTKALEIIKQQPIVAVVGMAAFALGVILTLILS